MMSSFRKRMEQLSTYSWEEKLRLQCYFPVGHEHASELPLDLPNEAFHDKGSPWEDKKRAAAHEAVWVTNKEFSQTASSHRHEIKSEEQDESDDCSSSKKRKENELSITKYHVRKKASLNLYSEFFEALPNCLLFDLGFRVDGFRKDEDMNCCCPCGTKMKPWRDFFLLNNLNYVKKSVHACDNENEMMTPIVLMTHLRSKGEHCLIHRGMVVYLECLYGDYLGPDLGHTAIYPVKNPSIYMSAISAEIKQKNLIIDKLRVALRDSEENEVMLKTEKEKLHEELKVFQESGKTEEGELRLTKVKLESKLDRMRVAVTVCLKQGKSAKRELETKMKCQTEVMIHKDQLIEELSEELISAHKQKRTAEKFIKQQKKTVEGESDLQNAKIRSDALLLRQKNKLLRYQLSSFHELANREQELYEESETEIVRQKNKLVEILNDQKRGFKTLSRLSEKNIELLAETRMETSDQKDDDNTMEQEMDTVCVSNVSTGDVEKRRVSLTDCDILAYRGQLDTFISCLEDRFIIKRATSSISIKHNFRLQELFDDFYELKNSGSCSWYLMTDLSGSNGIHHHAPKLLGHMDVQYEDHHSEHEEPLDEKGPSCYFFREIWKQMGTLKVQVHGVEVSLFEFTGGGYVPVRNELLMLEGRHDLIEEVKVSILDKAKRFYRAVGRLMFRSLFTSNPISSATVPMFYRNVIFRECNFNDSRYPRSEITKDLQAIGRSVHHFLDTNHGKPLYFFTDEKNADILLTAENFFTKVVPTICVKGRSIALDSIKEGFTLDGFNGIQSFLRFIPIEAVSEVIFSDEVMTPQDVIGVLIATHSNSSTALINKQKQFFNTILKDVIMEKGSSDNSFLRKFVLLVTGSCFIPHRSANPEFRIEIEFDPALVCMDCLVANTCKQILHIPVDAYNGEKGIFERKLNISLEQLDVKPVSRNQGGRRY